MTSRVGFGYDAHRLVEGRNLILCGVHIPFNKGLEGWSDGDAGIHAIIDALLGAATLGDIGVHFPSSDSRYKDISSGVLLQRTAELLGNEGWVIGNIDATIVAQEPRLAPYIMEMRQGIANVLSVNQNQVGIKAKTNDGMGFAGRGEGIIAYAVVLVKDR